MKEIIGKSEWRLPSEDYGGLSDDSRVEVYREDGRVWLELACNGESRRLQIHAPAPGALAVDESRLNTDYPICADSDRDVASVAEQLGLRVVS